MRRRSRSTGWNMTTDLNDNFLVLLEKYLDGTLAVNERRGLHARLAASPQCRQAFLGTLAQEAVLRSVCQKKLSQSARFEVQKILQLEKVPHLKPKTRDHTRIVLSRNS